jgi:hypothetical protein
MKLNKELAKFYYTAIEARNALGLDEEAFQYWGRTERVKRIYLPNRKQAVYSRKEVNQIANKMEAALLAEQSSGLEYRKATLNDLDQEIALANLVFGGRASIPEMVNLRRSYMEKNPDTTYHLYKGDQLVSYINMFPFDQEAVSRFKEGTRGWLLGVEHMEQYKPEKQLECIIIDLATTPTVPPSIRVAYAWPLLENFGRTLKYWGENGVEISKVYAASNTASGIRILNHAGFEVINDLGNGRYVFGMNVKESQTTLLREYKEALNEWKELHHMVSQTSAPKRARKSTLNKTEKSEKSE